MKTTMRTAISRVKKRLTASQTANMASTSRAVPVACSGKNGMVNDDHISGGSQGVGAAVLAPQQQRDHQAQAHHAEYRGEADDGEGGGAVPGTHRVVVKTDKEHLVDGGADAVAGGLDQPQPHVARRELDAVEVARGRALAGQQHDARGVRELLDLLVVEVAEADRAGEPPDRLGAAGQEMPAVRRLRAAV